MNVNQVQNKVVIVISDSDVDDHYENAGKKAKANNSKMQ